MENKNSKNGISRRDFINRTAMGAAALALTPVNSLLANPAATAWPKGAGKFSFYMIGHGHIDPVWLWPWTEGVSVVHSTFRSALDRMNESSDVVFTGSSAQFYQWVSENDPAMLAEIRRRITEGRWNIVGGWWIEPDVNIPSGEAMARQGLYGQLTLQRLFGRRATVAFNPDSFGHASTLPQIFKLQGMENYVFMRPQAHEKTLPSDLFWWEAPDGSRVLTYRIQFSYNTGQSVRQRLEQIMAQATNQPMSSFMAFYGFGDHGGGPTKEHIRAIEELKTEKGAPAISYSSIDRYFNEIRADGKLNLPVVKDDLQHHAVGCYTAEWEIKKNNRQAEAALVTAEKMAVIGSVFWKYNYPKEKLTSAWHKVLFLQFHDSLAGTSLYAHSQDAREGHGYALDIARETTYMSLQKLEWQIATEDPGSEYLVVFNPHAWEVKRNIEYDLGWNALSDKTEVTDAQGHSLPHQWTAGQSHTGGRKRLICRATLPPMGYSQIRVKGGEAASIPNAARAEGNRLENEFFLLTFFRNGTIGIFDKKTNKDVFTNRDDGCRAVIINDPSDTWSHDIKTFSEEIGSFANADVKILENGPLRATTRVISTYGASRLTIDWSLSAGSGEIAAGVTLDWHEHHKMLKFSFPVDVNTPTATYETPYGHIVRATNGDEDPGLRWIDVSGKNSSGDYGLTVLNDAKYGYSVSGSDMRISVARSAVYAHHNPTKLNQDDEYIWMDQGIQTFRMLLVPHKGSWKENRIPRIAEEFMAPPVAIYQGIHKGTLPKQASFFSVDAPNVVVTAAKKAEEGDDVILRLVETEGTAAAVTLSFPFVDYKWKTDIKPYGIKSLRVNANTGEIREVNLLEE